MVSFGQEMSEEENRVCVMEEELCFGEKRWNS